MLLSQRDTTSHVRKLVKKAWLLIAISLLPVMATAANYRVTVTGTDGLPVEDAVVELLSEIPSEADPETAPLHNMSQKNRTFIPFVMVVTKDEQVTFPNLDRTRHHVYSFSPAKPFELKLYVGTPREPVVFDRPGVVAIGCNIHDYMQAFIYVSESPYVAVTDTDGAAVLAGLPEGNFRLKVWHPWQIGEQLESTVTLPAASSDSQIVIDIQRQEKPAPPPAGFGGFGL